MRMAPRRMLVFVLPLLLLTATVLATAAAWRYQSAESRKSAGTEAAQAAAGLRVSLDSAVGQVGSLAGLFDASPHVTGAEFAGFGRRVVGTRGLSVVTWIERVPRAQRSAYERRTGHPIVAALAGATPGAAPPRPVSYPVTYAVTGDGLPVTLGIDVAREGSRRATLEAAARSGTPQATPPVTLLTSARRGIVIYEAVYDHGGPTVSPAQRLGALRGYVSGVYLLDTLFREVGSQFPRGSPWQVTIGAAVVRSSGSGDEPPSGAVESFAFAGRRWSVVVAARGTNWGPPLTFLGSGIAIMLLAVALTVVLGRRDRFAHRAVTAATEELAGSEERYRSLVSTMSDGVVLFGPSGAIIACNPAAEGIMGLSGDQMMDRDPTDPRWRTVHEDGTLMPRDERPSQVTLRTGRPVRGSIMGIHKPDGEITWVSVSTSVLQGEHAGARTVVACLSDITIRLRAEREHAALRRVATRVADDSAPSSVFELVAQEAAGLLGADAAEVVRYETEEREAVTEGAWARKGRPAVAAGTRRALDGDTAAGHVAAAPITVGDRLWGAILVSSARPESLPAGAEEQLQRFGELLTLAIVSADARAQLGRLASTDHLTGLWNRRAFEERLGAEVERATRHARPMSLLVIDVDRFKQINDTHGHPVGDRVLVEIAARLRGASRAGEIPARIGGEEFASILPETTAESALEAAARLRAAITDRPFPEVGALTVSAGVCDLSDAPDAAELFRLADVALYRAKAQGRDRTVRYLPEGHVVLRTEA